MDGERESWNFVIAERLDEDAIRNVIFFFISFLLTLLFDACDIILSIV